MNAVVLSEDCEAVVIHSERAVVVTQPGGETVVVHQPEPATVVVTRGIPGPPGGGAGAAYIHTQAIALAIWTVAHNLGRWPSVTVTDHLGRRIEPDVAYLSADLVQVTHGTPLTGFAYCN